MNEIEANELHAKVFAALSDPTRLSVVKLLHQRGSLNGTEISEALGISMALMCHHSSKLSEAGVVLRKRCGQSTYLTLNCTALKQTFSQLASPPDNHKITS